MGDFSHSPAQIRALRVALLAWYAPRRHSLPWRRSRDSYRIWVSEVMLQQTRIAVVIPAYERFLACFPGLPALAAADQDEVLSLWSGLGYYARARSLHRAAQVLSKAGCATFPDDMAAARALPGVGPYTAAAVLSIAYGRCHAAVDGNVVRVLSRFARLPRPDGRQNPHARIAGILIDPHRPGDWNQAMMELGQSVCLPRRPDCSHCPVAAHCSAHGAREVDRYPAPAVRRPTEFVDLDVTVVHDGSGRFLLERGAFPYLNHLWLPPTRPAGVMVPGEVEHGVARHAIVHRTFRLRVFAQRVAPARLRRLAASSSQVERRIFDRDGLAGIGRSSLLTKALRVAGLAT